MAEVPPLDDPTPIHGMCLRHRAEAEKEIEALREKARRMEEETEALREKVDP